MKKVLTIAGSDCSGGAGIQADLKAMSEFKCYGMSVITALTAQNTTGVFAVENCSVDFVSKQLDAVFSDIFPDAVKIGMVSSEAIIDEISSFLGKNNVKNLVLDPVMVSTSGSRLLEENAIKSLKEKLIPLATLITPNIYEAEILASMEINDEKDVYLAIDKIKDYYEGSILIKGGHIKDNCNDYLYIDGKVEVFPGKMIDNPNTHGTGCTLSSAIASNLALGNSISDSVGISKDYITRAIAYGLDLGNGRGPLNHHLR
ncbi:MAG: bifunctional hydroxymethylpyrimidine kinase/phosphomethylpyrimidine kinase [Firmicutes bacterium]|jgi:hydroxymethylpyrimidine kinase/phosphomethylpyrimidine kinase|nr:bifunctional hydroxymethylpyrimidine kinase/phosphomethylpyrimidine kinase [Bacillota bacterium]